MLPFCLRPALYNTPHLCIASRGSKWREGKDFKSYIWPLTLHQFRAFSPIKQKPALPMFYFISATNDILIQNLPINAKTHLQNQKAVLVIKILTFQLIPGQMNKYQMCGSF